MKDTIPAHERKFPHYLATGRLHKALEDSSKFKYVPSGFFTDFRFTKMVEEIVSEDDEKENDDDDDENGDDSPNSASASNSTSTADNAMMDLLKSINANQQSLSKRMQKVESKVGVSASPLRLAPVAPSLRAEKMKPRKIDLQSPQPVIIDISTGGSAFKQ